MLLVKILKCMFLIKNLRVYTIGKSSAVFSLRGPLCATFPYTECRWECVKSFMSSDLPESICNGPVIIEQRHPSWLLIRVKRLVKELKLIEKLRSQHQQTMRFSVVTRQHARCSLVISRVGNQARKRQANAWQGLVIEA